MQHNFNLTFQNRACWVFADKMKETEILQASCEGGRTIGTVPYADPFDIPSTFTKTIAIWWSSEAQATKMLVCNAIGKYTKYWKGVYEIWVEKRGQEILPY